MAEFIAQPNPKGNTAAYTDAVLDEIERKFGYEVELVVVPIEEPEYGSDEDGHSVVTKPGLYAGGVVRFPTRDAIESYLTLKERFPIQAQTALMQDMFIPGHYDTEVFTDTKVFMGAGMACQQAAQYKRGVLKKRARNGESTLQTPQTSTEKPV